MENPWSCMVYKKRNLILTIILRFCIIMFLELVFWKDLITGK